jgi:TetR/AcrR family transcriptional regulator, transcriptional repressor for nem operon
MKETLLTKSDKTRRFIIEKTAPIFNKKGIAGTSLSDLTSATGLTKGSIYGNFKNKDDLAIASFQYSVDNLTRYLDREIEKAATPVHKLFAITDAYRKLYSRMISYGGCPILNTAAEADDTHRALAHLAAQAIESLKSTLVDLASAGIAANEIDPDVDCEKFAETALATIEGGLLLSKLTGQKRYLINALEQVEESIRRMTIAI